MCDFVYNYLHPLSFYCGLGFLIEAGAEVVETTPGYYFTIAIVIAIMWIVSY